MPARKISPARLALVAQDLATGRNAAEIARRRAPDWGISQRQVHTYCRQVLDGWGHNVDLDQRAEREHLIGEIWSAIEDARRVDDWAANHEAYAAGGGLQRWRS